MSKSVYSVLLTDELVRAVDALAGKRGVSRSQMMDDILSEFVGVETPQKQMAQILSLTEKLIGQHATMRFCNMASVNMASVQSVLPYKHKPTVKYALELSDGDHLGALKVSLRSGNGVLLKEIDNFFRILTKIERQYAAGDGFVLSGGKYVALLPKTEGGAEQAAQYIAQYVDLVDSLLSSYFAGAEEAHLRQKYGEYLKNTKRR